VLQICTVGAWYSLTGADVRWSRQWHILVNECPVSKLYDGGLQRLHPADDVAVNRLEGMAMKAHVHKISLDWPSSVISGF